MVLFLKIAKKSLFIWYSMADFMCSFSSGSICDCLHSSFMIIAFSASSCPLESMTATKLDMVPTSMV